MTASAQTHLGIDFTSQHLHVIEADAANGKPRIRNLLSLHVGGDGILDSDELSQAFRQWLDKQQPGLDNAVAGLPTFLTSTALFQFPLPHSRDDIDKIILFQTRQLCGMAEESFCSDSQYFGESGNGLQSAIISVCKESELEAACARFGSFGISLQAVTSGALSLANAFAFLHPREAGEDALQLILNIDQEETILVLWKRMLPLQIHVIPLGEKQLLSPQPQKGKGHLIVRADAASSQPLTPQERNILQFIQEIKAVLRQLPEANGQEPPRKVWLTGNGALCQNLPQMFRTELQTPAEIFGLPEELLSECANAPRPPEGGSCLPSLTIAFGMVLQSLELSAFNIRLLPERVRWQREKLRKFPVLVGAVALLLLALCLTLAVHLCLLNWKIRVENQKMQNLQSCLELIPELEKAYNEMEYHQRRLLPMMEYGLRVSKFTETLESCGEILRQDVINQPVYCVYLADEFTFAQSYPPEKGEKSDSSAAKPPREELPVFAQPQKTPPPDRNSIAIQDFPILRNMYIGGLTLSGDAKFFAVKEIQTKFHERALFSNVDDIIDSVHFEQSQLFPLWNSFFETQGDKWKEHYSLFLLQMPFQKNLLSK